MLVPDQQADARAWLLFSPTRNQVDNPRDERHLALGRGAGRQEVGG